MRKQVLVSDLTGAEISDLVQIRLYHGRNDYSVDLDRSEDVVEQLLAVATKKVRRGRKPKGEAAA